MCNIDGLYGNRGGMIPMIIDELRECEASSFIQTGFSKWQKCNVSDTLRASGGDNGGGGETLIIDTVAIEGNGQRESHRGGWIYQDRQNVYAEHN